MARILEAVDLLANEMIKQKDYLTALDKAIADGDHGINMARGFTNIKERVATLDDISCKSVLECMGRTLLTTVGGAAGPLYGNGFIAAAEACPADAKLDIETIYLLLTAAVNAIQKRGRSKAGDKTMLDVLIPVQECFSPEYSEGRSLAFCMDAALKAAKNGVIFTSTIPARRGKASYIGEASIGHEDPGATSSMIMVKALYDFLKI